MEREVERLAGGNVGGETGIKTIAVPGLLGDRPDARGPRDLVPGKASRGSNLRRQAMLVLSLLVMGLATFFIGLLSGALGVAAPSLLVVLRFLQGVGFGGEWGGAVLMSAEHAPRGRRGLYAGFPSSARLSGSCSQAGPFSW